MPRKSKKPSQQWTLTVDGKKYDWVSSTITGSDLRALIPGLNPTFAIIRERENASDEVVTESQVIELKDTPIFYTAPPATFGSAA